MTDKYRVTKPVEYNKRKYHPGDSVKMTGREAEEFFHTGCLDNKDRRDRRGRIKHELDKTRR